MDVLRDGCQLTELAVGKFQGSVMQYMKRYRTMDSELIQRIDC